MRGRKLPLSIAKSTGTSYGMQTVSLRTGSSLPNVPADRSYQADDDLLVCWVDDDSPVIIGRPGYTVAEEE